MDKRKKREETKILSIGAAVQDVFLKGKIFIPHREKDGELVEEFKLGSKNDIEDVFFNTGGGATNAAVTFARQGLHSMFMGKIGHDEPAEAILNDLHKEDVDTSLIQQINKYCTGYSCLLLSPKGERTILTYRGASAHMDFTAHDFHGMDADWFLVTSMAGNLQTLDTIFTYAENQNINIAMIPGENELKLTEFKKFIPRLKILAANKEELSFIYGDKSLEDLVLEANKYVEYVIGTNGPKGSVAANRNQIIKAGMYEDVPVIDRTGAGDAFASGFISMVAAGESLEKAVIFASANSTSVVGQIGAKAGILHKSAKLHSMPLKISNINQ